MAMTPRTTRSLPHSHGTAAADKLNDESAECSTDEGSDGDDVAYESSSQSAWNGFEGLRLDERYVLSALGSWSRDEFALRVLALCVQSDDEALAYVINSFPSISLQNAKLWLAYMKDARERGTAISPYIMDTFRQLDWCGIMRHGAGEDLAPELHRLFLQASPGVENDDCDTRFDVRTGAHELASSLQDQASIPIRASQRRESARGQPVIDLIALDEGLSRLYAQAHDAMLASSQLARDIIALKERLSLPLSPVDESVPWTRRSTTAGCPSWPLPRTPADASPVRASSLQPAMTLGPWHEFVTAQRPASSIFKEMMSFRGGLLLPLPKAVASWKGHPFIDIFYSSVDDRNAVLRAFRAHLSDAYEGVKAAPAMLVLP
ncbi:hypothetical protein EXIGLDRAFT_781354 [Exidia glandulosa HHB12029]|uniref:Uncharacterized protein n=1 Tax=Exidia glandulosa HHB12029 TaxID=1314781 RepID=A0A166NE06_EXIGL|nr:hypothetical protein EXIGLDRAFT_782883 [Exidia glandulosa HHB12029]KZV80153.1 hypothetical protein EXIGLDRAFT_781354 [Exidia glandulosa HHB12029]